MPAVATDLAANGSSWVSSLIGTLTILLGGGGLAALMKVRHDKRMGIAQQEAARNDAVATQWEAMSKAQSEHWQGIIEKQTKSLLEPLSRELAELRERVAALQADLNARQQKYWTAITHIRMLYSWISTHLPDADGASVPEPPAMLAEDI
jgi:hypothetical protein